MTVNVPDVGKPHVGNHVIRGAVKTGQERSIGRESKVKPGVIFA